jgi:hypothetical protein
MTNEQLIRKIKNGTATNGERRTYAARVSQRSMAEPCEHGHFGCALVEGGPCLDETLGEAEMEGK